MNMLLIRILTLTGLIGLTCTTKVSEWVLLNEAPEDYLLVCYHTPQTSGSLRQQNENIAGAVKDANIKFRTVVRDNAKSTYYELSYRNVPFAVFNNADELKGLSVSPLRKKVADEIMAGKLCVMVYLRSGDEAKDKLRYEILKEAVDNSPFGSAITVMELGRNDPEELHFSSMLLNVEDDLKDLNEPMLYGVFGRFRALEPLVGRGITDENIDLMIDFLTADCSCLIKDDLPGASILFTNKWENPMPALVNRILDADPILLHH
ncbi:MAG TPA: hypothetical protein PLV06_00585 [Bacteroidales bacterium]|nr:hypothetical protein [Bacteroidales bacterium]HPJ58342.1 hypothetical protein [Bacteroidales bacterium]HPR10852.1 hypothetical protein [Bacteroidales bacterium]